MQVGSELKRCWDRLPNKLLFGLMLLAWILLFQFLGNSTLGYVKTPSLFGWMKYAFTISDADELGAYMPLVVIGFIYWKRDSLVAAAQAPWWPALILVMLGLVLHWTGYVVQQTRLSIIGFFIGLYGLTGMVWGWRWLKALFFPFCLFVFCVPLATETERITFPMRLLATKITGVLCQSIMGIPVRIDGTMLLDAKGQYHYEIAAACSGIKSLSATVAISVIAGFVFFKAPWRRFAVIAAAFPLAVMGNVLRLVAIIVASEGFGPEAGKFVHDNSVLSLLPYVPAIGGVVLLVKLLGDQEDHPELRGREPFPDSVPQR
jgi:exosortase